jgi:DNA/RNA-binding domain of Phe-tRNA-synthetase-like protein
MSHQSIQFSVSTEVQALGLTGICFAVADLSNKAASAELDAVMEQSLRAIVPALDERALERDPILSDFRRMHQAVGATGRRFVASPENLLKIVRRTGRLPTINLLVDIYNLVSVETRLSLGAHDIERVSGNISLRLAVGTEKFIPLGSDEPQPVRKGEYCYIDDANDVLCRLEVRQADKTKLTAKTRQAFFMIQGNGQTSGQYLHAASDRLLGLIHRFCGGDVRQIWKSE